MKWENINLHIENIIPGIVTLVLILVLLPKSDFNSVQFSDVSYIMDNSFFSGGVFIATSYLIGIFSATICRLIIDLLSACWPRPILFKKFYPEHFHEKKISEINSLYRGAIKNGLDSETEYKREEIKNRRERGRLLRSGTLPSILILWWVTGNLNIFFKRDLIFFAFIFCVFLYAYIELTIYQEAILGETTLYRCFTRSRRVFYLLQKSRRGL